MLKKSWQPLRVIGAALREKSSCFVFCFLLLLFFFFFAFIDFGFLNSSASLFTCHFKKILLKYKLQEFLSSRVLPGCWDLVQILMCVYMGRWVDHPLRRVELINIICGLYKRESSYLACGCVYLWKLKFPEASISTLIWIKVYLIWNSCHSALCVWCGGGR